MKRLFVALMLSSVMIFNFSGCAWMQENLNFSNAGTYDEIEAAINVADAILIVLEGMVVSEEFEAAKVYYSLVRAVLVAGLVELEAQMVTNEDLASLVDLQDRITAMDNQLLKE